MWSGEEVLPDIPATLNYLRQQGKQVRFLSNNILLSCAGLKSEFDRRGVTDVAVSEVLNAGSAAALYLMDTLGTASTPGAPKLVHGNVFVLGERGLHDEVAKALAPGYYTYGSELDSVAAVGGYDATRLARAWQDAVLPAPLAATGAADQRISLKELNAVAVVAALDWNFNMVKLACASMILQGPPASVGMPLSRVPFIATNLDPSDPAGRGLPLTPASGGVVTAVEVASGRAPDVVSGKPGHTMGTCLFRLEGVTDPRRCLMVGDRLETDIEFGLNVGCQTLLVLSGAQKEEDVRALEAAGSTDRLPDSIADSLAFFLPKEAKRKST